MSQGDSRTPSPKPATQQVGRRSFVLPPVCAHRGRWLDGPCRDVCQRVHRYCGSWVSLPLICGEVRIHTWFSAGCCWSCVTPGSHLPFFLMKWNPGTRTNGPKAKGRGGGMSLAGQVPVLSVWLLAAALLSTHRAARASCRATLYSMHARTEQFSATQRRLLAGSNVPAF